MRSKICTGTGFASARSGRTGVILVRPDNHIGWRAHAIVEDPEAALSAVLAEILSRGGAATGHLAEEAEAALAAGGLRR